MGKIGLNVGSGQRKFYSVLDETVDAQGRVSQPGIEWINVDSVSRFGHEPDLVCDGAHLPYEDGSVDYFVLSHTLEHFGCGEATGLITEAYRVLKPRGSLIVSVPDLNALAKRWLAGGLTTQIYVTNLYGAYMGDEADRHKWGFDAGSLFKFLRASAPWMMVTPFDWRPIPGMDLAQDFWILGAEARK